MANRQVRLSEETCERIKSYKRTPRESYDEIINRLLDNPSDIRVQNLKRKQRRELKKEKEKIEDWREYSEKVKKYRDRVEKIMKKHKRSQLKEIDPPKSPDDIKISFD